MDQGRIREEIFNFYINENRDTVPKPMGSIKSSNNGEVCNNKPNIERSRRSSTNNFKELGNQKLINSKFVRQKR